MALRSQNPSLKILASLGGANAHSSFDAIVENSADIESFAAACAKYTQVSTITYFFITESHF